MKIAKVGHTVICLLLRKLLGAGKKIVLGKEEASIGNFSLLFQIHSKCIPKNELSLGV